MFLRIFCKCSLLRIYALTITPAQLLLFTVVKFSIVKFSIIKFSIVKFSNDKIVRYSIVSFSIVKNYSSRTIVALYCWFTTKLYRVYERNQPTWPRIHYLLRVREANRDPITSHTYIGSLKKYQADVEWLYGCQLFIIN